MRGPWRAPRRHLVPKLALVCAVALFAAACSLVTTWDGLSGGAAGDDGGPIATHDGGHVDAGDGGLDGNVPVNDSGKDSAGGGDAAPPCVVGGYYCGGHDLAGDPATLYTCKSDGSGLLTVVCSKGCVRRTNGTDSCECVQGGRYCGNDQVVGDSKTLYTCNGASPPTVFQKCPTSCVVNVGADDTCQ